MGKHAGHAGILVERIEFVCARAAHVREEDSFGAGQIPGGMPEFLWPVGRPPAVQVFGLPEPPAKANEDAGGALIVEASVDCLGLRGGEGRREADGGEKRHRDGHQHTVRQVAATVACGGADSVAARGSDFGHGRGGDYAAAQCVCECGGQAVAPAPDLHEVRPLGEKGTRWNGDPRPLLEPEEETVLRVEAIELQSEVARVSQGEIVLRRDPCSARLRGMPGCKRGAQGQNAPAHAFAGLKHGHIVSRPGEFVGRHQTGHAGADHDNAQGPAGWRQRSGRVFRFEGT